MEIAEYLVRLRVEGEALAAAAEAGPLEARVPGCPDWDVEALVRHIGDVHRWAATIVRERRPERLRLDFEGPQNGEALLSWYRDGHAALIDTLADTSPAEKFWAWGPAPSSVAFWARRQAQETGIHRFDAESARGGGDPFPTEVALDGIDEWLNLAAPRAKVPQGGGRTLHVHATDGDGEWLVTLGDAMSVSRDHAKADCAIRGAASDLFLLLMNRRSAAGLEVFGDASVLRVWSDHVKF